MLIYFRLIEAHLINSNYRDMALAKLAVVKGIGAEGMHGGAELGQGRISLVLSRKRSAIIIIDSFIFLGELDFYGSRYHRLFFAI